MNKIKNSNKSIESDFLEKSYLSLTELIQYIAVSMLLFYLILPMIFGFPLLLYIRKHLDGVLLLFIYIGYLYVINFVFPKFSFAKRFFGYKLSYDSNSTFFEKLIYSVLTTLDGLLAPFNIFICNIFKFWRKKILFSEKYSKIQLVKIKN